MERSSGTPSSHQLAATPTSQFAYSSSSGGNGGGQGGGNGTPPIPPRFNVPDSYWTHQHIPSNVERFMQQSSFTELAVQHVAASRLPRDVLLKAIENHQEDRKNDPRTRIQGMQFQLNIRPIQVPELVLAPDILAGLVKLNDPDDAEPQPQSSTSSTSSAAAAATQQIAATGGSCIPPGCNIV